MPFRGFTNSREFFENLPQDKNSAQIFVDYELGEENGLEIARKLKADGFENVCLATGESHLGLGDIKQVGKEFPIH